jgi:predicted methyltransferase
MLKSRVLACLLTLSAIAAAPAAISQTAPDYAAIVAAPDRSDADRKLDTNRAPAKWLAFIGAKPGMKILDIEAVYGWKAELLARAVVPGGKVYAQNSEAAFARVKDRLDARLKTPAAANIVSVVRPFDDPAPTGMHDFDLVTFFYGYHDVTNLGVDRQSDAVLVFHQLADRADPPIAKMVDVVDLAAAVLKIDQNQPR